MLNSWRGSTLKQYAVYIKKWNHFLQEHNYRNDLNPPVTYILEFLSELYDTGCGYSALNTARSALSSIVTLSDWNASLGEHHLVRRFLKGVYNSRPSTPKYTSTWDVSVVLTYLKSLSPSHKLDLQTLTCKLITLCFLVTGQRCQTIHLMDLRYMHVGKASYKFYTPHLVKHSRPGTSQPLLVLPSYPPDRRLCVTTYLKQYLKQTKELRDCNKVFISYIKPHKSVTRSTIARWVKTTLSKAGIDTNVFGAHSTRAASTTACANQQVPLDLIMKTAGWSQTCTFTKFYKKPTTNEELFGLTVLNTSNK